jgi:hypothetical protein
MLTGIFLHLSEDWSESVNVTHLATLPRLNCPDNCLTLDISKAEIQKGARSIAFLFVPTNSYSVEIQVEDKHSSLVRVNPGSKRGYSGARIERTNMTHPRYDRYVVDFSQRVFVEEDLSIGCKNYPGSGFNTFNDCDERSMLDEMSNSKDPLWPVFIAPDERNATPGPSYSTHKFFPDYYKYMGYAMPACPLPCIKTDTSVSYFDAMNTYGEFIAIELVLPENILVTTTAFPGFTVWDLLSILGSTMGLWLGLGVLQAGQVAWDFMADRVSH